MLLKAIRPLRSNVSVALALFVTLIFSAAAVAQTASIAARPVADRLVKPINESARVTLAGTVHPLASPQNDRGAVSDGLKLDRLQIVMKRSDAQEAELKQLISDMHTPGSASYHKWLTPDEFGTRFGPSDADVAKLEGWLQSHGFSITKLNPGRQTLEIAGSAGQFRDTFKTQIHSYQVKGETHFANLSNPQIPEALAPVFGGFASLNNFRLKSYSRKLGTANYNPVTHETKPNWTVGSSTAFELVLAPQDFAVQYDLPSQTTAGTNDGTGQSIAIVNEANVNISLVNRYRALFNLPVNPPQIIIDGNDPGIDGINNPDGSNFASGEAYLDVELAGAVAPGATINLVIAADTALSDGLFLAAERAVYGNISPIISLSFGNCEAGLQSTNSFLSGLWEQAAAQGITVAVSSGDNGSAGCDDPDTQPYAVSGAAVSGFASTPYNVAVGGTDFYYTNYAGTSSALETQLGTYWNLTPNNQVPTVSLLKPVPEQPWNDSQYGLDVSNYFDNYGTTTIAAGSGGKSSLGLNGTAPYPKPSWQTGTGVPADGARDLPDLSLFASNGSNLTFYPICAVDADCVPATSPNFVQFSGVGGTSASTPAFAGIMALVNQKYGRQGQANFVLYPLAKQFPAAFHDVTAGSNTVPCNTTEAEDSSGDLFPPTDCLAVTSPISAGSSDFSTVTEGEIGLAANTPAYNAGTGYDLASGLGSVDASVLLADWNKVTFATTAVTLTPSSTSFAHGTAITVSGAVTGTPTPTGDVALMTDSTELLNPPTSNNFFTLANGAYTGSVNYLPGGTYNIWGNYGGDASNAASSSIANKVQITVTPETSGTALSVYTASGGGLAAISGNPSLSYGQQLILEAQAGPKTGTTATSPTGNVVFKDGTTTVDTAVINADGDAEYYYAVPPGSHTITANYSGDNSYSSSTSTAQSFTVVADTPTFIGPTYSNSTSSGLLPGQQTIIVGVANGDINGDASFSGNAVAPAGTLAVTGAPAGTTASVTLVPAVDPFSGTTEGVGTFIVPAGVAANKTYNLTFTYTPSNPTYYNGISGTLGIPFVTSTFGSLTSTTTATATPTASSPAALVLVTTTITGQSGKAVPTGTISFYTSDTLFGTFTLPTGSGDSTSATVSFDSAGLIQGTNQLTVQYSGDGNYLPSASVVSVTNPLNDFQMVPLTTIISVPSTNTATDTIELTSTNTFAGAVTLSCKGAGGVTCSLSPASATLAAGAQTSSVLTVNTAGVTKTGTYNVVVIGSDSTGNFVHTLGLQVVVPQTAAPTPGITVSASPTTVAIASQGASGTSTVSVTPTNSFTGNVGLTCAITASPASAIDPPTCSFATASVSVTGATAVTDVLTISTTAPTTAASLTKPSKTVFPGWSLAGATTLAALFFLGGPIGRRRKMALKSIRTMRILSAAILFVLIASGGIGCGGSSSGGGGSTGTLTADANGPYTGTVGNAITFSGAGSTSPTNQTITSYAWNFGDSATGTGATPTHAYSAAGTYTATLTITDTSGAISSATATVTVTSTSSGGTTTGAYTVTITATPATGTAQTTTIALTVGAGS